MTTWTTIESGSYSAKLTAMMRHLGISETSFAGLPMESAIWTCFSCQQADQCRGWLADPGADPTAWQRFCPNAPLFRAHRDEC